MLACVGNLCCKQNWVCGLNLYIHKQHDLNSFMIIAMTSAVTHLGNALLPCKNVFFKVNFSAVES